MEKNPETYSLLRRTLRLIGIIHVWMWAAGMAAVTIMTAIGRARMADASFFSIGWVVTSTLVTIVVVAECGLLWDLVKAVNRYLPPGERLNFLVVYRNGVTLKEIHTRLQRFRAAEENRAGLREKMLAQVQDRPRIRDDVGRLIAKGDLSAAAALLDADIHRQQQWWQRHDKGVAALRPRAEALAERFGFSLARFDEMATQYRYKGIERWLARMEQNFRLVDQANELGFGNTAKSWFVDQGCADPPGLITRAIDLVHQGMVLGCQSEVLEYVRAGRFEEAEAQLKTARQAAEAERVFAALEGRIAALSPVRQGAPSELLATLRRQPYGSRPFRLALHPLERALEEAEAAERRARGR